MRKFLYIIWAFLVSMIFQMDLVGQDLPVFKISKMPFDDPSSNEISPVQYNNGILFCSDRRLSTLTDRKTFDGRRLYNIYFVENDSTSWANPELINNERSARFNNGPVCIAPDGKTVYFTSEVETGNITGKRNFVNHSGIFTGILSGNQISSVEPFKYNSKQYEVGHPSISSDGRFLYFSSNMPGGHGKSDLYYCELIKGEWAVPVNLGPKINSKGRESFPFIQPSGKLYFASDRTGGYGRLDIYSSTFSDGEWNEPFVLPEPINSAADDFAFTSENFMSGFFSSNRSFTDDIFVFKSTIIRKATCNEIAENNFCYSFTEENAVKYDTLPFLYRWKFGDGSEGEGPIVEHCYDKPGKYIVRLDVVNLITNEMIYDEKTDTLNVERIEQASISAPDFFNAGKIINLDARNTNLPGWDIDRFYWNFGDETAAVGETVMKKYKGAGLYNIQLIVTSRAKPGEPARETCVSKNIRIIP